MAVLFVCKPEWLLRLEGGEGGADGGELLLGVALFLALHGHDGFGGVGYEFLVAELFLYAGEELGVLVQLFVELGNLFLDINLVGQWY